MGALAAVEVEVLVLPRLSYCTSISLQHVFALIRMAKERRTRGYINDELKVAGLDQPDESANFAVG